MANGDISDGLKRRVAQRAAEYGAGEPANEGSVERIVRDVDEAAKTLASDVRLAHDLAGENPCIRCTPRSRPGPRRSGFWCCRRRDRPASAPRDRRPRLGRGVHPGRAKTLASDVRLAHDLALDGRGSGVAGDATAPRPPRATGGPDWDAVFTQADRAARAQATGNDLGMSDAWYGKHFKTWLEGANKSWKVRGDEYFSSQEFEDFKMGLDVCRDAWYGKHFKTWLEGANKSWKVRGDEYFSSQEFEDFKMVLDVCRETGVEPLIVIQPVKGAAYDQTVYTCEVRQQYYRMVRDAAADAGFQVADLGVEPLIVIQPVKGAAYDQTVYTCEVRQQYYRMVRDAAADAGFQVADFSGHEYDRYFLRDYSHPSELGSAYYSKAIYTFLKTGHADTGPSGDVLLAGA